MGREGISRRRIIRTCTILFSEFTEKVKALIPRMGGRGPVPIRLEAEGVPHGGWVEPKPDGDATGQDPFKDKRLDPTEK